jgi:Putative phage serine protease XkdF
MTVQKDATASSVHTPTALGNDRKKRKATMFSGIMNKPAVPVDIDMDKAFAKANVVKVDEALGLVFGFAIICKQDGQDYYDLQEDHIPEASMLKAALDFMENSRVAKEMHAGDAAGGVPFALPITTDMLEYLVKSKQTGLLIGMLPSTAMLGKFKSGEYTGFSIGGHRLIDEEVA